MTRRWSRESSIRQRHGLAPLREALRTADTLLIAALLAASAVSTASTATAGGPADALAELARGDASPATRDRLVEQVCAAPDSIGSGEIEPLFHAGWRQRTPPIDGARIARCAHDPDLAPLAPRAFLDSKLGRLRENEDIYGSLLEALAALPEQSVRAAFEGLPVEEIVDTAALAFWRRNLLPADAPEPARPTFRLDGAHRGAAEAAVRAWAAEIASTLPDGLVRLRDDSGNEASRLARVLGSIARDQCAAGGAPGTAPAEAPAAYRRDLSRSPTPRPPELAVPPASPSELASDGAMRERRLSSARLAGPTALASAWLAWAFVARAGRSRGRPARAMTGVLIAVTMLASCETALGLAGVAPLDEARSRRLGERPDRGPPMFVDRLLDGRPFAASNPDFSDGLRESAFQVPKPAATWRVFSLGESSTRGEGYPSEQAFTGVLANRLRALRPEHALEVVNAGVSGALSDDISSYADQVLAYQPDLLILYFGFNDFSYAVQAASDPSRGVVRLLIERILGGFRIPALLHEAYVASWGKTRHDSVLPPDAVAAPSVGPPLLRGVFGMTPERYRALFEWIGKGRPIANLRRIARRAATHGTAVLLVAQARQDVAPLGDAGDASYELGWASFPTPEALRRVAIEAAQESGVPVVDGQGAIRDFAHAHQLETSRLFFDSIHPTALGHAVLGEAIAPQVASILASRETEDGRRATVDARPGRQ